MIGAGFKSIGDPLLAVADPVLFPFWIADANWARDNRAVLKRWVASLEDGLAGHQERRSRRHERFSRAIPAFPKPS